MKLSVIIVTYQKIEIVRDCLDSIKKFNDIGDELEVIVSDNSEDNTLADTIRAEYGWVKVIKNENKGFGAGNNRGYEVSSGEYLLFLNPDTILVEPIFKFAIEQFEDDSKLALFGVQLLDKNRKKNKSFFVIDRYSTFKKLMCKFCRKLNIFIDGKMFISGANLFVRRESFEQAGKFDEKIFMYREEEDLTKRIKLYSWAKKIKFFRDKHIIHLEGGTEVQSSTQTLVSLTRVLEVSGYYADKWGLNVKKIYHKNIRYETIKLIIYFFLLKKDKIELQKKKIGLYRKYLEKLKA